MNIFQKIISVFLIIISYSAIGQIGGNSVFNSLRLANSPRVVAMGGDFLAINDDDITLALSNPSLISEKMNKNLSLNFIDYFSDINYGFASFSKTFKKSGSFVSSLQFVNYGKFTTTDATGQVTGNFTAGDYTFNLGWGRKLNPHFSIGSNLKFIYSKLETYTSTGIAVDVAGSYHNKANNFCASLLFKNIGAQITTYIPGDKEPVPFEIQAGLSKKLEHVPFRLSLLFTHLEKWDLSYEDPLHPGSTVNMLTGAVEKKSGFEKFTDNAMRHIVVGGEFSPSKNFFIRLGYNYKRRKEMQVVSKPGTVGFSWGIGVRISKFNISYARSAFHAAGSPNYISITTNLSEFVKKSKS